MDADVGDGVLVVLQSFAIWVMGLKWRTEDNKTFNGVEKFPVQIWYWLR